MSLLGEKAGKVVEHDGQHTPQMHYKPYNHNRMARIAVATVNMRMRCFRYTRIMLLPAIILVTACGGCAPPPPPIEIPCNELTGNNLARLFEEGRTSQGVDNYLKKNFDGPITVTDQPDIIANGVHHTSQDYQWQYGGGDYALITYDAAPRLVRASYPYGQQPTLASAINCFGPPSFYSAQIITSPVRGAALWIYLFYLDSGITLNAWVESFPATEEGAANEAFHAMLDSIPLRQAGWVTPGTLEDMDWQYEWSGWSPDPAVRATWSAPRQEWFYPYFRPWPGDIKQMVITYIDPLLSNHHPDSPLRQGASSD